MPGPNQRLGFYKHRLFPKIGSSHLHRATRYSVFRNFPGLERLTTAQFYLRAVGPRICPLAFVTGFQQDLIRPCMMHSVHLGICQWLNGCAVHDLIDHGYLGPPPLQSQLNVLCKRFNDWCKVNRIRHYQPYIPAALLLVKAGDYPELRLKAWCSRVLTSFCSVVLQDLCAQMRGEGRHVPGPLALAAASCQRLSQWMLLIEQCPRYLTVEQAENLQRIGWEFLDVYQVLAGEMIRAGILRYPVKPKHHVFQEMNRAIGQELYNPRMYHTYLDEDCIGSTKGLARACHRSLLELRVLMRSLLRLRYYTLSW